MPCPLRYATKRQLQPNISAYPVAREVIAQAVQNTWDRALKVSAGEMSMEALEEANLNLVLWLQDTFSGANAHFSCESEFNGERLPRLLRESIGEEVTLFNPATDLEQNESLMFSVFAYFVSEIFVLLKDADCANKGLKGNPQVDAFIDLWSLRLTGAPVASDFRKEEY
ncbi:MAG TPA: hypothetical protein IAC56_00725 [Candidatus Aphodousia faecigallinarum]|uniref:Uncharacterized protein n=1 Tax=Candidatus Aphodousia faecigallinarum TaxID=2840677 RepID=A0A9D1IJ85_9BURK|nr:hypothetical protein [Candidatus Aphodousia faecigallinarum]